MRINFLLLSLTLSFSALAQKDVIRPTDNFIAEGIPDIPASMKESVRPYLESRSAGFADWHPKKNEMLISTRFGNSSQIHHLAMPLGMRRQITFFEDAVSDASYEPVNGNYFLFTKDQGGNEFGQIYRYDLQTAKSTLLTDGGRSQNGGIVWNRSGDKSRMLYASTKRNGADRDFYSMDPLHPEKEFRLMENKGGGWYISDWVADNILIVQSISANESRIWRHTIGKADKTPLTDTLEKLVWYGRPKFTNDLKSIFLLTDKGSEFKQLAKMDAATGKLKILTNISWDVESYDVSTDEKTIVFITNEAGESKMYILSVADGKYKQVNSLPRGVYSGAVFHNNGRDVALSVNSAGTAADIFVVDIFSGKAVRWTESEMGGMSAENLVLPELISWKSFDGREITGFYFRAAKAFQGKKMPVIINIHGGPEAQSRPVFQGSSNYYMNEMGIAMIYPNVRGSSGFGKTFLQLDNGYNRENSVKDIGALLDWIATRPELDATRVMITGGSYGGYMTLAVATHYNDRIRCGIDIVGISNFNTFLKNTESYRRDLRRVEYGDERDPDMYAFLEKISPLNNAQKITKPLFIVQGGNDPRVPRTEAEQMASRIRSNGGVVWYLEAKDEGHGFRKKSNADYLRLATISFIEKYLLN